MPRVKRGVTARARHKKVLIQAKGYRGRRTIVYRIAKHAVTEADQYQYRDSRKRKRQSRLLWIARINAAARELGVKYSTLMDTLQMVKQPENPKQSRTAGEHFSLPKSMGIEMAGYGYGVIGGQLSGLSNPLILSEHKQQPKEVFSFKSIPEQTGAMALPYVRIAGGFSPELKGMNVATQTGVFNDGEFVRVAFHDVAKDISTKQAFAAPLRPDTTQGKGAIRVHERATSRFLKFQSDIPDHAVKTASGLCIWTETLNGAEVDQSRIPQAICGYRATEIKKLCFRLPSDIDIDRLTSILIDEAPAPIEIALLSSGLRIRCPSSYVAVGVFLSGAVRTIGTVEPSPVVNRARLRLFSYWNLLDPDDETQTLESLRHDTFELEILAMGHD